MIKKGNIAKSILVLACILLLSACSVPPMESDPGEQIPEPAPLVSQTTVSKPPLIIMGGNLSWHKRLPGTTWALEAIAVEVKNLGDIDVYAATLEVSIGDQTEIIPIQFNIAAHASSPLVVEPTLKGFEAGEHNVYIAFLDFDGNVIFSKDELVRY